MTILTIVPFVAGCLVILIFWGAMILLPDNRYDKMFGCLCCLFSVAQPAVFTVLNYAFLLSIFAICELVSGLVPEKYAVLISFLNPVLVIFSWYVAEKLIEEVIFVEPMKKHLQSTWILPVCLAVMDKNTTRIAAATEIHLFRVIPSSVNTRAISLKRSLMPFTFPSPKKSVIGTYAPIKTASVSANRLI